MARESSPAKLAVAVVTVFLLLAMSVAGSYALSLAAINQSQHSWCDTLTLITASPTHPTTEQGRIFYARLHELEHRFGC
jgi:hypothetical protein